MSFEDTNPPTKSKEAQPWQLHEDHVASLYRMLGYTTTPNINVNGQQADLLCKKWISGIGQTTLYVDCKHTQSSTAAGVSKDDVDQFIASFQSRSIHNRWTA